MKRLFFAALAISFFYCTADAVDMRVWIALSPDYQGEGSEFIISWDAIPGESYYLDATTELGTGWEQLNVEPIVAQSDLEAYRDQTASPRKFYRVWKLEADPPKVSYLNPWEGAIAVGRQEPLTVYLEDESGIDPASIAFSIGSGPTIGVDDPGLTYADGILTYAPGPDEYYGDYAESVTASLSVSDRSGNRLEDYTWSFKLGFETILARNVRLIGDGSPLTFESADGDTYTFTYTGPWAGVSVGDILASTDAENPYKRRALNIIDNPHSHTLEVQTEPVALGELLERGSVRARFSIPEQPPMAPLFGGTRQTPPFTYYIVFRKDFGGTVISHPNITVEVTSGSIEFLHNCTAAADFEWFKPKSFDLHLAGTLNLEMVVKATARVQGNYEYSTTLAQVTLPPLFFSVGPLPVVAQAELEFNIGFVAEAEARGEVTCGFRLSKSVEVHATLRDGQWSAPRSSRVTLQGIEPTWQIEGVMNLRAYVQPKLIVYLYGVAGASVDLKPYLQLYGWFQRNPEGYEAYNWTLYAGLMGDLAIECLLWEGDLPSWNLFDVRETLWHTHGTRSYQP